MPILVLGLSHHSCPVTVRERFAFAESALPGILSEIRAHGLADEAVVLSTCNRVELYAATSQESGQALPLLRQFLIKSRCYGEPIADEIYGLAEPQSLHHLFKVAAGLDSMVLGETEILGQLKKAYDLALQGGHTGPRLNKAFQKAFNVAKQIRTETNIQRGSVSVGSVAVELAQKIFEDLCEREVLVIGAGDTSEKTARALMSRGTKSVIVTNRSAEKAASLAAELGGRAVDFGRWSEVFPTIDIVISSTSAPSYVLDSVRLAPLMKLRRNRPLLLIDIAVPRDIDPEVNALDNIYLYNIDDLQAIADDYLKQRRQDVAHCEALICEKVAGLIGQFNPTPGVSAGLPAYGR